MAATGRLVTALVVVACACVARASNGSPSWYTPPFEPASVPSQESTLYAGAGTFGGDEQAAQQYLKDEIKRFEAGAKASAAEDEEEHDEHWHKPLFPLDSSDYLGFMLSSLGLMIAAGGGIGGGGILVPLYVLILGFSPKFAIPLSNITVFGGAVTNYVMNLSKRHPDADRPLVDWDLILVMEPLTILGALVGSFLNKMLPEELLTALLVLLLTATAYTTTEKGIKSYNKETQQREAAAAKAKESELTKVSEDAEAKELDAETEALLPQEAQTAVNAELQAIYDEERTVPLFKVGVLWAVFAVVLFVNLMKGGGAFPSPIGIECGSPGFFFATTFMFGWILFVSWKCRDYLIERFHTKARLGYKYVEGDIKWDESATITYPLLCALAGVFAGMFGIGGGIVKGPLMLKMGVHPKVSSASSACMIMYTSFTATTSFFVFGLLRMDYAVPCLMMGLGVTAIGQMGLSMLIKQLGRDSLIIFSIAAVVGLSAVLMGLHSVISIMGPNHAQEEASFCDAGE